uniref:Pre-SET domain-containing protein n=1 Tax=Myripristis murdjan TaxID=586833 RepID=A0A668A8C4_9TELE
MEETSSDPEEVVRARTFWAEADVDQVFEEVLEYLDYLKSAFKKNTATDKEYVHGMKLLAVLDFTTAKTQEQNVVQVVIGSDVSKLLQLDSLEQTEPSSPLAAPLAGRDGLAPLAAAPLQYEPHDCCPACLPGLPSMPQSTPPFWGQNPLKVPLLCGFHRLSGVPVVSPGGGGAWEHLETEPWEEEEEEWDVVYKAPCGKSLRCYDEVMHFLLATESYGVLQVDFFSFNAAVRCDPPRPAGPRRPELDLSRGAEPTPVELCVGEGGLRPDDFRYRKDRWPHGCFLSRGPALFAACCDCTDGCWDAANCACVRLTRGGRHYSHHRLSEPVPSGLYECGPWCGCDGARCQNRLVQRGIRVRLQVFRTADCGWGVRCRDDLDQGTFVCTYAGNRKRRDVRRGYPRCLCAESGCRSPQGWCSARLGVPSRLRPPSCCGRSSRRTTRWRSSRSGWRRRYRRGGATCWSPRHIPSHLTPPPRPGDPETRRGPAHPAGQRQGADSGVGECEAGFTRYHS